MNCDVEGQADKYVWLINRISKEKFFSSGTRKIILIMSLRADYT